MSELQDLRDRVKATMTMDDVCDRLGIHVPSNRKIQSIYKPEKTPSLHLYKADYYDYASGQGGDVIRFVMDAQGWGFKKAVKWLAGSSDTYVRTRRQKEEEAKPVDLTATFRAKEEATMATVAYSDQITRDRWGVPIDQVLNMGSKLTGEGGRTELWTPHWHDNIITGIKVRAMHPSHEGKYRKWSVPGSDYKPGLYWPERIMPERPPALIIVEGESDAWALLYHFRQTMQSTTFDIAGLPSGAGMWRDTWRTKIMGHYTGVYVAFDTDHAGEEATQRVTNSLLSVQLETERPTLVNVVTPPLGRVAESLIEYPWDQWLSSEAQRLN